MTSHKFKSVICLPAYNESLTIENTIRAFNNELPEAAIWVINNASLDSTAEIASQTISSLGCSGGVITELRKGKANAVRRAFLELDSDIYILCDADLTYPAHRVKDLIAPVLSNQADMVVGDRLIGGHYSSENKRRFHGFGNRLVSFLVNTFFKANLSDIMSGYRVFSRRFVKSYPILVEGFELETDVTLHALDKRLRIIEIGVEYKDRPEGSVSKLNTIADGFKVIFTILQILRYYRPLVFFGSASFIFGLFGLLSGLPVVEEYLKNGIILHVPLAILAVGLEIVAVLLLSIGLILDAMVHQDKRSFERELLKL